MVRHERRRRATVRPRFLFDRDHNHHLLKSTIQRPFSKANLISPTSNEETTDGSDGDGDGLRTMIPMDGLKVRDHDSVKRRLRC